MMLKFAVRPICDEDGPQVTQLLRHAWGDVRIVSKGVVHRADELPGFGAWVGDQLVGLVTYHVSGDGCEIVTINSVVEEQGIGRALAQAVAGAARTAGCRRLWVVTTNDNLQGLGFYQRRGFRLVAVYPGAIAQARRLKPQIPQIGLNEIPVRDEIELELILNE